VLGEHRHEGGEHRVDDVLRALALDLLDAVDERGVGVGQQVRRKLRQIAVPSEASAIVRRGSAAAVAIA
jgi:hypothetical protein